MRRREQDIRVGLVGCGQIAQSVHLKILSHLPGARLAAIAEADDGRRRTALELLPETRAFSDYRELLPGGDVEAVVVSLPTDLHAAAAIAAFEAGKHVYLEKPLATDADDADAVLFNRLFREAKRLVESTSLGRPVAVRTIFSSLARPQQRWMQARGSGGGVLLNLGSHHFDLVRFLFGDTIEAVTCELRSAEWEEPRRPARSGDPP